ncbi:MAG TPA: hypothetical protein VF101_01090 [Gaiellaceae bacterium]
MATANVVTIKVDGPAQPFTGDELRFEATGLVGAWAYTWLFHDKDGKDVGHLVKVSQKAKVVYWRAPAYQVAVHVRVEATNPKVKPPTTTDDVRFSVQPRPLTAGDVVPVTIGGEGVTGPLAVNLRRSAIIDTPDLAFWSVIRASSGALAFNNYADWMDSIFCGGGERFNAAVAAFVRNSLPFPDIISYKALKLATEAYLLARCGVIVATGDVSERLEGLAPAAQDLKRERFDHIDREELDERLDLDKGDKLSRLWKRYLQDIPIGPADVDTDGRDGATVATLPYLALVRRQLPEMRLELRADAEEQVELCYELMGQKFTNPCFLELIWSYWHEEGMLVQTMNAISMRFQNRASGPRDPLAAMALDPLRPLNNLLWGYIQDEQHRLTLARRVAEYDQEYGLTLFGRAVPQIRTADPRSRFLQAFHTLLHRASIFYKEDDDTTMIADPFPVLNALRDVHLVLSEGAHNQYGDLPWTARHEMLIQQWLLARPELREFLPSRIMVVEPEPWMHRVDAMKKLQEWTDTPVRYFHDLGVFGEQLLLSIRFGNWGNVFDREQAGNWARYWRQEVQWYIHAYHTVTGVDLSADTSDVRQAQLPPDRYTQPAFLLRQRLTEQRRRLSRGTLGVGVRRQIPRRARFEEEQFEGQP